MHLGRVHPCTASKAPPGTHTASHTRLRVHRDQGHCGLPLMNWELREMLPLWDDAGLFMLHIFLDYSDPGRSIQPSTLGGSGGLEAQDVDAAAWGAFRGPVSCLLPQAPSRHTASFPSVFCSSSLDASEGPHPVSVSVSSVLGLSSPLVPVLCLGGETRPGQGPVLPP